MDTDSIAKWGVFFKILLLGTVIVTAIGGYYLSWLWITIEIAAFILFALTLIALFVEDLDGDNPFSRFCVILTLLFAVIPFLGFLGNLAGMEGWSPTVHIIVNFGWAISFFMLIVALLSNDVLEGGGLAGWAIFFLICYFIYLIVLWNNDFAVEVNLHFLSELAIIFFLFSIFSSGPDLSSGSSGGGGSYYGGGGGTYTYYYTVRYLYPN